MRLEGLKFVEKEGGAIAALFDDLAGLRIKVFRAYPYLYEGSVGYEREYLKVYSRSARAYLYSVYDGDRMVGATTCLPLADETAEVRAPFVEAGLDLGRIFYFGESILLPEYRGLGLGHRFFDVREAHAGKYGVYGQTCFCAVQRPDDHPMRPVGYQPLDAFWTGRGYQRVPTLQSGFSWQDLGEAEESVKPMVYWMRDL